MGVYDTLYGINPEDLNQAKYRGLAELGRNLVEGAMSGSWGGIGTSIANGTRNMTQIYDSYIRELSDRRMKEAALKEQIESSNLAQEAATLANKTAKREDEQILEMQKNASETWTGLEQLLVKHIDSNPQRSEESEQEYLKRLDYARMSLKAVGSRYKLSGDPVILANLMPQLERYVDGISDKFLEDKNVQDSLRQLKDQNMLTDEKNAWLVRGLDKYDRNKFDMTQEGQLVPVTAATRSNIATNAAQIGIAKLQAAAQLAGNAPGNKPRRMATEGQVIAHTEKVRQNTAEMNSFLGTAGRMTTDEITGFMNGNPEMIKLAEAWASSDRQYLTAYYNNKLAKTPKDSPDYAKVAARADSANINSLLKSMNQDPSSSDRRGAIAVNSYMTMSEGGMIPPSAINELAETSANKALESVANRSYELPEQEVEIENQIYEKMAKNEALGTIMTAPGDLFSDRFTVNEAFEEFMKDVDKSKVTGNMAAYQNKVREIIALMIRNQRLSSMANEFGLNTKF